jgi:Mn-dependent DtxR family transcriptional regulator
MTTEEAKRSISYSRIVTNLLALRDEARETSHGEAEAIERIVTDVTALQLRDGYIAEMSIANRRN